MNHGFHCMSTQGLALICTCHEMPYLGFFVTLFLAVFLRFTCLFHILYFCCVPYFSWLLWHRAYPYRSLINRHLFSQFYFIILLRLWPQLSWCHKVTLLGLAVFTDGRHFAVDPRGGYAFLIGITAAPIYRVDPASLWKGVPNSLIL